jgi:hypothetical protein
MTDELEDFWGDIRPPAPPRPPAAPQPPPEDIEKGFLWAEPIVDPACLVDGPVPRVRVPIPEGLDMEFLVTIPGRNPPITAIGIALYDQETGGEVVYVRMFDDAIRAGADTLLDFRLRIEDQPNIPWAGFRTNLRLRGLL